MKKIILLLIGAASMASFPSIYPISAKDRDACFKLSGEIAALTNEVCYNNNTNELQARVKDRQITIRSLVRRMNYLMHKYPNEPIAQGFAPIRDSMEQVLDHYNQNLADSE